MAVTCAVLGVLYAVVAELFHSMLGRYPAGLSPLSMLALGAVGAAAWILFAVMLRWLVQILLKAQQQGADIRR